MNSVEAVKILIAKGANINLKNKFNMSPLYLAMRDKDKEIVENLIKNNANIKEEVRGKSMLHFAIKRITKDNKREIYEKNSIAMQLIEKGVVDLTASTMNELVRYDRTFKSEGRTQLMYHIINGNEEAVEKLIYSKDINLLVEDTEKVSAYGYAMCKGYEKLAKKMEEREININKTPKYDRNILGIIGTEKIMDVSKKRLGEVEFCIKLFFPAYKPLVDNTRNVAEVVSVASTVLSSTLKTKKTGRELLQ